MPAILPIIFKYAFIVVIYLFVYGVIRLIYLDIHTMNSKESLEDHPYLRLINLRESLSFRVEDNYVLNANKSIGRLRKNDISVQDPYISSIHAQIVKDGETYLLEDLESTNGTYLNGRRLGKAAVPLQDGDKISIGQMDFLFVNRT